MKLLRRVESSIYDLSFYRTVGQRKLSGALGYFALLVFVLSLLISAKPFIDIAGFAFQSSAEREALKEEVASAYPDELIVTIENGRVSTNVPEPYPIPFPEAFKEAFVGDGRAPQNLLVINTGKSISADDFEAFDTFVILGGDSIGVYQPDRQKAQIQGLAGLAGESLVIDKEEFISMTGTAEKFIRWMAVALLFLVPLIVFFMTAFAYLFYLLFGALLVMLVAKLRGVRLGYKEAYKAGLYLLTLPMLYEMISSPLLVPELHIPLVFTALLAVAAALNFSSPGVSKKPGAEGIDGTTLPK